ncbi:MAG: hypothetical protein V4496_01195 [Pseudomonadota bacterium]
MLTRNLSLSRNIQFVGNNIYLITTALAIYISAKQHLSNAKRNEPLASSDILNIAIVPFSALFALWSAACRIYETIPQQFEGAWQLPSVVTITSEVDEVRRFSIKQIEDTRSILFETALVQTVLTLALILAIKYFQEKLSGNNRFVVDTLFYILETADYGFNLKALESIETISRNTLQPPTLHPALRVILPTNSAIVTRNNRLAFTPIPTPRRRMSVAEGLGMTLFRRAPLSQFNIDPFEEPSSEDEKSDASPQGGNFDSASQIRLQFLHENSFLRRNSDDECSPSSSSKGDASEFSSSFESLSYNKKV